MTRLLNSPTLSFNSSASPFLMPENRKSDSIGRSCATISTQMLRSSSFVMKMLMLVNMFWAQSLLMALAKLSPPGMVTSSPTERPDTEITMAASNFTFPVTLMSAMVYFLGILASKMANSSGSTEAAGMVSVCANPEKAESVKRKRPRNDRVRFIRVTLRRGKITAFCVMVC